MVYAIKSA